MLIPNEIEERALCCYLVFRQLGWLYANSNIHPTDYIRHIQSSSLRLGDDDFIMARMEKASVVGAAEETLREVISFYEGMTFAFAAALGWEMDVLENKIPVETWEKLAREVGVDYRAG